MGCCCVLYLNNDIKPLFQRARNRKILPAKTIQQENMRPVCPIGHRPRRQPQHPTFGLRLVDSLPTPEHPWPTNPTNNVFQIGQALLSTLLSAHDRLYMDDHTFVRTIAIPVEGISGTRFDLKPEEATKLYQNGSKAAEDFLSTWNFEAYKAAYRGNLQQKGRRERLHEEMKRKAG